MYGVLSYHFFKLFFSHATMIRNSLKNAPLLWKPGSGNGAKNAWNTGCYPGLKIDFKIIFYTSEINSKALAIY
jgi:hypothetical protein